MGGLTNVPKHPTSGVLESFLLGKLAGAERKAVVAHLLQGCPSCQRALAPLVSPLFEPELPEAPDDGWRYEFAIRRAMRRTFSGRQDRPATPAPPRHPLAAVSLLRMPPPPPVWRGDIEQFRRCEAALEETRSLGKSDPEEMLALAIANATFAEHLDPTAFVPGAVHDLQARAYAELGNARRITNDFPNAEADFWRAAQRARMGSRDLLLAARLDDLAASLYRSARRFEPALLLLDRAYATYRKLGEDHLAGRTLINKGIAKGAGGDVFEAIALLRQGVRLVDRERDPALLLAGVHNLIAFEVDGGQFVVGRELLQEHTELYERHGGFFDRLRLRWLEGRVAAGLGELAEAEGALLAARAGFAEHRLAYVEALISLDLAALWLRQGRKDEIRPLVEEMLGTFRALDIRREATAVLLMLAEAAAAERLTPALLRSAAARLRRLEREAAGG
jgi:tetratricopeptide (TPR) repeat protein